jgi:hypothetical protein
VYRPENIPGFVFEEVTVKATDQTLAGPLGAVENGLVIEELHMDGGTEQKSFAPGYGEFFTAGGGDVEALALAVPTDALPQPVPPELEVLERGALELFDAAGPGKWGPAPATVDGMTAAWRTVKAGAVPNRLEPRLSGALDDLSVAVEKRDAAAAREAAIGVARWTLDLQLRYRPVTEVDRARFDLWAAQMLVDGEAGDPAAVNGDYFSLDYIRDRIQHVLGEAERARMNLVLEELNGALRDEDLAAVMKLAEELRTAVRR